MATNADQIVDTADENASDHALAAEIAEMFEKETPKERDPATGRFVPTKESETVHAEEAATDKDAAPAETQPSDETEEAEPADEQPIDPPPFWTKEQREEWSSLTPRARQIVLERETERDAEVRRGQNESAEARKKYDTEAEATKQERQRYVQVMQGVLSAAPTILPIVAEGRQTDWAKASVDDPIGTQTKWFQYQQAEQVYQAMQADSQRVAEQNMRDAKESAIKKLHAAFPEFADEAKGKAERDSFAPILLDAGFSQAEIDGVWSVPDPRIVKVLREAREARQLKAAKNTLPLKKVVPSAPTVAKPKASSDTKPPASSRIVALEKRAAKTDSPRDLANWIAAQIEEKPL